MRAKLRRPGTRAARDGLPSILDVQENGILTANWNGFDRKYRRRGGEGVSRIRPVICVRRIIDGNFCIDAIAVAIPLAHPLAHFEQVENRQKLYKLAKLINLTHLLIAI